jgi:hypothetical protein
VWKPLSPSTEMLVDIFRLFFCGVCEHLVW